MNYLLDAVYQWLQRSTEFVSLPTTWIRKYQTQTPPVPQSSDRFGYFGILTTTNLAIGAEHYKYNSVDDKVDVTLNNYYNALVTVDIYTKDMSALDIAGVIMNYVYSDDITEYFFENNVGFLEFQSVTNLSEIISGQTRNRIQVQAKFQIYNKLDTQVDRIISAPVDLSNIEEN